MRLRICLLVVILLYGVSVLAQTGDGIPDNCEHASTSEQLVLFPRYEPHNQRIVLVDWNSGADIRELDTNLTNTAIQFRDWTADCRYLIGTSLNSNNNTDTVIWDTVAGHRVFTIVGERYYPYTYHLYPDARLIVETVQGGLFINIPTGTQVLMPALWNEVVNRNFSRRPTLNDEQGWVVVLLQTGENAAYEQSTGNRIADYLRQNAALNTPEQLNSCYLPYDPRQNQGHRVGYYVRYEENEVRLYNSGQQVRTLRANLETTEFQQNEVSDDCRYYSAAVLRAEEDVYDTYVWDTQSQRELRFEDAQFIPHPFTFLTNDRALVQTRNGAYLWNVTTDERVLLTTGVREISSRWSPPEITNFQNVEAVDGLIWAVTIAAPHGVSVYDVNTGVLRGFYDNGGTGSVSYQRLHQNWLVVYPQYSYQLRAAMNIGLWNIATGTGFQLRTGTRSTTPYSTMFSLSDDERYFLYANDGSTRNPSWFYVWDLHNLPADGAPTSITQVRFLTSSRTVDFQNGIVTIGERSYDVFTGEMLYVPDERAGIPVTGEVFAPTSACSNNERTVVIANEERWVINFRTGERITSLGRIEPIRYSSIGFAKGNCYITLIGRYRRLHLLWDGQTYNPIELPLEYMTLHDIAPDGQTAFVSGYSTTPQYRSGYFLWHIPSNNLVELQADVESWYLDGSIYWDYARGQVLARSGLMVRAFALDTGIMRTYYEGNGAYNNNRNRGYSTVLENRWLVISGSIITVVYDLNTGTNFALRTDERASPLIISADGRYVVVAGTVVRVWDMSNQPQDLGERQANYFISRPTPIQSVHFVDATTIEIGERFGTVTRWNVSTGDQIE
jgi:hypothetical protein